MNVIVLNESEFTVTSYSKVTTFSDNTITSTGYIALQANNMEALEALGETPITSIKIYHDEALIYELENINAHIDLINETLGEDQVYINVNMTFIKE